MDYQQFITYINKRTAVLPAEKLLPIALKICKELYFDYQSFFEVYHWGDPDVLMDAISLCSGIPTHATDLNAVRRITEKVKQIVPDTENFEEPLGSYALNASAAVMELLQFVTDNDKSRIENIILYYIDTIDLKIQHMEVLEDSARDNHPLMIEGRNKILALMK